MNELSNHIILSVEAVEQLLRSFVVYVTELPDSYVIIETKARPRPKDDRPYVTLYWLEQELLTQLDGDYEFSPPELFAKEGVERRENAAHCTVRITTRGPGSYSITSAIRYAIDSSNRSFDLWPILGYAGVTNITDLSAVYGGKVQQRSFIDFSFYAAFGRRYELSWFSSSPWIINGLRTIFPRRIEPCPKLPL